ncbi:MAG: GNAT family N-acetyltransferase [Candidatus Saccharimonadales bacterium]
MSRVYFEIPTIESKQDVWEFRETFEAPSYITNIPGASGLEKAPSYEQWLEMLKAYQNTETLPPGKVLSTTFLVRRAEDRQMIGIVNIRHELNEHLLAVGGHVGYSIGPEYRGKGYGTELLRVALAFCESLHLEKVLVTCDARNSASAGVIQANGGVLENEVRDGESVKRRYWITLRP